MNISKDRIQAYIERKGWEPVANDSQWNCCISDLVTLLGREFHYRVKTITQQEDSLRRFCTRFPDQLPEPYRFIDWLEFGAYLPEETEEIEKVRTIAESNGIIFELIPSKFWMEDEERDGSVIRIRGFKERLAQPGSSHNVGKRSPLS